MDQRLLQLPLRAYSALPFLPSERRYNLTVSAARKFIWFRVAKVGTRTILNALGAANVPLDLVEESRLHYFPALRRDYFKFAFVRNPWDRLVSSWMNKVVDSNFFKFEDAELLQMRKFENFVAYVGDLDMAKADRHLAPQSSLIDLNNVDFIGRMERFDDGLATVFERIGVALDSIDRKNASETRTGYQDYYTAQTMRKAQTIYARDVSIFGYEF